MTNKDTAQALDMYRQKAQELDKLIKQGEAENDCAGIWRRISALAGMRLEIGRRIDAIGDDDLRRVLYLRYIHGLIWLDIAARMGITYEWAHKLHRRALEALTVEELSRNCRGERKRSGRLCPRRTQEKQGV